MEKNSSNGWKFFAILFGALLAGVVGLYVYKQQNPDYDPSRCASRYISS